MPTPLLSTAEMAEADRLTITSGTSGFTLMEAAGRAVADAARAMVPSGARITILAGPGNNGGDGFVAGRELQARGHEVTIALLGDRDKLRGDAALAAARWEGPVLPASQLDLGSADLVIDALYGAGLSRDVTGQAADLVRWINGFGVPVLAVDVPSGIDGNTGQVRGTAIEADATVTFFRPKPGHFLEPGAAHCGRLAVAEIGIEPVVLDRIRPAAWLNEPALWEAAFPWPQRAGHKYSRGHALVVSGPASQTGAARLSARAALRMGAGLVTLASPPDAMAINASQLTAVMVREAEGAAGLAAVLEDGRKNAVVMGPGLGSGEGTRHVIEVAITSIPKRAGDAPRAWVFDADALTSFEGRARALATLIGQASGPVVVTPHDGEFARLFSAEEAILTDPSKLERARAAAALLGAVVVLKGSDTVVADPGGRAAIAQGDAPWLATAGSGDVLSGFVGGLLAQGVPAFEAAAAAVWHHAAAARHFGPGLIAEDLPDVLPAVLRERWAAHQLATVNRHRRPLTA